MRILAVADNVVPGLYEYYSPSKTKGTDFIISCGDLRAKYLEFLVTVINRPLLYVRGNHDTEYKDHPPEGCICLEDTVVLQNGLRILGLGGSIRYNNSPFMYTERQMAARIRRLRPRIRAYGGVDIVVTHAPASGYGDLDDLPHLGFECFNTLLEEFRPMYMLHGHVHKEYGDFQTVRTHACGTTIINCCGSYTLDIPDDLIPELDEKTKRSIRLRKRLDRFWGKE